MVSSKLLHFYEFLGHAVYQRDTGYCKFTIQMINETIKKEKHTLITVKFEFQIIAVQCVSMQITITCPIITKLEPS